METENKSISLVLSIREIREILSKAKELSKIVYSGKIRNQTTICLDFDIRENSKDKESLMLKIKRQY